MLSRKYIFWRMWIGRNNKTDLGECSVLLPGITAVTKHRKNSIFVEKYLPVIDFKLCNKFPREMFKLCHLDIYNENR